MELPEGATLDELFRLLRLPLPLRHGTILFSMVNHEKARPSRVLSDGDRVSFISVLAGG